MWIVEPLHRLQRKELHHEMWDKESPVRRLGKFETPKLIRNFVSRLPTKAKDLMI